MKRTVPLALLLLLGIFAFCRGRENDKPANAASSSTAAAALPTSGSPSDPPQSGDKGVGPVKELKLGPLDEKLVARGKQLFADRCAACHGLDKAMTGPALGDVLKRRSPEFVMNMILNTAEMLQKDEIIKKLVAKFSMPMPPPGLTSDQARAVLEYFRTTSA
jgi:cytochrome c